LEEAFQDAADHIVIDEIYVDAADDYVSRIHLAFQARSREDVDTFHRLALEAGGRANGAPGLRPYHDRSYAAFVFDPDGNNIEAVCDAPTARNVDSFIEQRT
jgi:predicted lactoylglutathione lyase